MKDVTNIITISSAAVVFAYGDDSDSRNGGGGVQFGTAVRGGATYMLSRNGVQRYAGLAAVLRSFGVFSPGCGDGVTVAMAMIEITRYDSKIPIIVLNSAVMELITKHCFFH